MISFKQYLTESKKKSRRNHFAWQEDDYTIHSLKEDVQGHPISNEHENYNNLDKKALKHLNSDAKKHTKKLSQEHMDAIERYKGMSSDINNHHRIRKRSGTYGKNLDQMTHHLDDITSGKTSHDFHAYRSFASHNISHLNPGEILHDKGYTGTSLDHEFVHEWSSSPWNKRSDVHSGHKIVARIHVPAGTKGHYLDHHDNPHKFEKEFLLHRGTHFKVTHHTTDSKNKIHYVHMTVHHQDEH
jgi:hypothetical protein